MLFLSRVATMFFFFPQKEKLKPPEVGVGRGMLENPNVKACCPLAFAVTLGAMFWSSSSAAK